jgi:nitric oxide reductase large subunit
MKQQKLVGYGVLHAVAVFTYVALVVLVMSHGEAWFGRMNQYTGPLAMLMLFVLSAAVVGSLVFLRPVLWFLDGKKKEAVHLLVYTIGVMAVVTILLFAVVALTATPVSSLNDSGI